MQKIPKKSVAVLASVGALVAAASAFGAQAATAAGTITVTAGKPSELRFTLSKKTASPGVTTFRVMNKGMIGHDFTIAGKRTKVLAGGKSQTITVKLKKGRYAFLCTVPGHAAGGMKGVLTVK